VKLRLASLLLCTLSFLAQAQTPVFRAETNLQSIAVQVTDKEGHDGKGLTASDFTLLEDGRPQKIAFFEAEAQPVSLAILLDVGRHMDYGGKLDRALALLAPLMRRKFPEDEIFFMPFTDETGPFQQLTAEARIERPTIPLLGHRGASVYDALASALCHLRAARNVRQAIIVLTDGVDQSSRLRLEQLIELVRSSNPQVFMMGLYDAPEYELFQRSHKTVTIVGRREIDNPVVVFRRLAKESGAESFFPGTGEDFEKALSRISALLQAQYTLAYYPQRTDKMRKIEVKVNRNAVNVTARGSVGSESPDQAVHFASAGCKVSAKDHPYPWESRITSAPGSPMVYHEDFSDTRSGWPNRRFNQGTHTIAHYTKRGYEISRYCSHCEFSLQSSVPEIAIGADTVITAYGPWWDNFRASVSLQPSWDDGQAGVGMIFDLREDGYYAFLITPPEGLQSTFELVRGTWNGRRSELIPRTPFASSLHAGSVYKLTVERNERQITLWINDQQVGSLEEGSLAHGLVGAGVFGSGSAIVHDLRVEAMEDKEPETDREP
jgi:Ca-activated chloride channel family protein